MRPDPSLLADLDRCDMIGRAHLPRQPRGRGSKAAEEMVGTEAAAERVGCPHTRETRRPLSETTDHVSRVHAPPQRAVVADDGRALRLTVYRGAEPLAAVDLDPVRALALVQDLLDAARRRLVRCTISPT